jgi:hypothetical protein
LKAVRWKSEFQPDLVEKEMVAKISGILSANLPTSKMLMEWREVYEDYPLIMRKHFKDSFMEIVRARQSLEWSRLINSLSRHRKQNPEVDVHTALQLFFKEEITEGGKERRLASLREEKVEEAYQTLEEEILRQIKWDYEDVPDGVSQDDWDDWCERFQEAREALKNVPQRHIEQVKVRTQDWFENAKREWFDLAREAIQTDRKTEKDFGNSLELKIQAGKARIELEKAQECLQEPTRKSAQLTRELVGRITLRDRQGTLRVRTEAEFRCEFRELEETQRKAELKVKHYTHSLKHAQNVYERSTRAQAIAERYFKDLKLCWQRLRQVQFTEYTKLGMSTSALVAKVRKESSKGHAAQASAVGASKPNTHLLAEMAKAWVPEKSNKSSRKGSRNGKHYGKICHKVEHEAQILLDAQSDRRGPPTDRPPHKPPPWKGVFAGSLCERASSRHASQLASSRGTIGLSGKTSPLEKSN